MNRAAEERRHRSASHPCPFSADPRVGPRKEEVLEHDQIGEVGHPFTGLGRPEGGRRMVRGVACPEVADSSSCRHRDFGCWIVFVTAVAVGLVIFLFGPVVHDAWRERRTLERHRKRQDELDWLVMTEPLAKTIAAEEGAAKQADTREGMAKELRKGQPSGRQNS